MYRVSIKDILMKLYQTKGTFRVLMAAYLITFSSIYIMLLTFLPVPLANVRFADTVLGFLLGTVISTIMNYYYGNSVKEQTNEISRHLQGNLQVHSDETVKDGS